MSWGTLTLLVLIALVVIVVVTNLKKVQAFVEALKLFYSEVAYEMTKVVWPSQSEVVNSTIIVIVVSTILTLGIMLVDATLGHLVTFIFRA
jgi:preprotein translocase SecE subunit